MRLNPLFPGWYRGEVQALIDDVGGDDDRAIANARRNTDQSGYDLAILAVYYLVAGDSGNAGEACARALESVDIAIRMSPAEPADSCPERQLSSSVFYFERLFSEVPNLADRSPGEPNIARATVRSDRRN